jgi:hypothetical protein
MEAQYLSVPKADDSLRRFVIFSTLVLLFVFFTWYINQKIKEKNDRDLPES